MFKNMKALPKALILAAIVGLPVAAYVMLVPQKPPVPVVQVATPVAVPAESAQPAPVAVQAPPTVAPLPIPVVPALTPAPANDAGLNNLLK